LEEKPAGQGTKGKEKKGKEPLEFNVNLLRKSKKKKGGKLHHFCLMATHYGGKKRKTQ